MFTAESVQAINEAEATRNAFSALAQAATETNALAAIPDHFNLHDLEKYLPTRRRARGNMNTTFIAPFAKYVVAHGEPGATVFVDPTSLKASAVLNLGTPAAPGHADNRAGLVPTKTAAYAALISICNNGRTQKEIAEFLEDWTDQIQTFTDAGPVHPKHAIAAIRKLSIESSRKAESSVQQLSASASMLESVTATSADPIPTGIVFTTKPYADLQERTFSLRLSVSTANDKFPTITLRIIKEAEHQEAMANELGALIEEAIAASNPDIPVLIGTYSTSGN